MHLQIGIMLLSLASLAPSYGQNQAKVYREPSAQMERLRILGYRGTLNLKAQAGAKEVMVKITRRKGASVGEWRESVRREGNTFVVEIQPPLGKVNWTPQEQKNWPQWQVDIVAPELPADVFWLNGEVTISDWRAPLRVNQQVGKLQVHGGEGETYLSLLEGKLTLSDRRGRVTLDTYNVDLTAKNLDGDLHLESFTGKTQVSDVNGQLLVHSGQGSFTLTHGQGALEFRCEKGTLNVSQFSGSVRGSSDQAQVSVGVVEPVDVRLKAQDGKLTVSLPPGSGASVNIETREGELALPRTVNVKRSENDRVALGEIPGSGHGYIFVRTETASVRVK